LAAVAAAVVMVVVLLLLVRLMVVVVVVLLLLLLGKNPLRKGSVCKTRTGSHDWVGGSKPQWFALLRYLI
jgi:hypothetical protein